MEDSKHLRLLTLFNEDYAKMITLSNKGLGEKGKSQKNPKGPGSRKKNRDLVKKFRKLVFPDDGSLSPVPVEWKSSSGNGPPLFDYVWGDVLEKEVTTVRNKVREKHSESTVVSVAPVKGKMGEDTGHGKEGQLNMKGKRSCINRGLWWWEPPEENLPLDFCRDTSLHGLKYIGQTHRHMSERIFWFVAFFFGLCLAFYLISDVWIKYNTSPIIVSFRSIETSVDQIPFPAVTICNMNKVLRSKSDEYLRPGGDPENAYYVDHVCSTTKSFSKRFNYTDNEESSKTHDNEEGDPSTDQIKEWTQVNEFLRKAAQNCSDMIPLCMWQDAIFNCSQLFRPIETEYGKCCVFNMVPLSLLYSLRNDERDNEKEIEQWERWNIDMDGFLLEQNYPYDFPRHQMQAGKSFGLSFVLNPALNEYFCTSSDSTGFRMSTHLSIDSSHVTDFGISIRPKAEVFVSLRPEITLVDPTIFKFPIETRNCYRLEEYSLKYYKYYTFSNCIDECIANETLLKCGCKRYYMPRDETESLCGGNGTGFRCAEDAKHNMSKFGAKYSCKMCLASCNEIEYQSQTTSTPLQKHIWMNNLNEQSSWATENVSIVHVFFGQDSVYPRVRKELFGSTDLFANTGGLMGLCLGFSGLSLMEVIYFLTLRAWWCFKRKQNENHTQVVETESSGNRKNPMIVISASKPTAGTGHWEKVCKVSVSRNPQMNGESLLPKLTKVAPELASKKVDDCKESKVAPELASKKVGDCKESKVAPELASKKADDCKESNVVVPVVPKCNEVSKASCPPSYKSILGDI